MIPSAIKRIPQVLCLILLSAALASCGGGTSSPGEEEGHGHGAEEGHEGGSTVTVSPQQFSAIEGKLGRVESKDLTTALKTTGFLKVPPQNIGDVTAALGGTIREVLVQEGDHVTKGQALASITDQAIIDLQDKIQREGTVTGQEFDTVQRQQAKRALVELPIIGQ